MQTLQQSQKRAYTTPRLVIHGSVEQLTHGEGLWGSDDMFVFTVIVPWGPAQGKEVSVSVPYGTRSS